MKKYFKAMRALCLMAAGAGLAVLSGCTPMMAGQVAEAGYTAAKNTLGVGDLSSREAEERQRRLQAIMNAIDIGQDVKPVLEQMGEPPKIKSGNAYGYTCYEYPSVYSAEEAAVIVAQQDKVVFYGSSRCSNEMQDANFRRDGKYMESKLPQAVERTDTASPQPEASTKVAPSQPEDHNRAELPKASGSGLPQLGEQTETEYPGSEPAAD